MCLSNIQVSWFCVLIISLQMYPYMINSWIGMVFSDYQFHCTVCKHEALQHHGNQLSLKWMHYLLSGDQLPCYCWSSHGWPPSMVDHTTQQSLVIWVLALGNIMTLINLHSLPRKNIVVAGGFVSKQMGLTTEFGNLSSSFSFSSSSPFLLQEYSQVTSMCSWTSGVSSPCHM